jgi:hypothetical protein
MTRDDIIRLAREAGAGEPESLYGRTDYVVMTWFELERFAALVSAAEQEECAKLCEEIKCKMWEEYKKHRETRFQDACDGAEVCENAIRARGET